MIDLHFHILHGLDDGARTWEESLELGRMAAADGTKVVAATPHSPGSTASRIYDPELIVERAAELEASLRAEGVDLTIIAGTEISFDVNAAEALRHGLILPYYGTRTVLLEPTFGFLPTFDTVIFELQALGYRVLLAHPERIPDVQHDPNRLIPLIERGVLMQITAEALIGAQGERMQHLCELLLTHNMVHVLASDAHRPMHRPPLLRPAQQHAAALIGEAAADMLVNTTPAAILADALFRPSPPQFYAHADL